MMRGAVKCNEASCVLAAVGALFVSACAQPPKPIPSAPVVVGTTEPAPRRTVDAIPVDSSRQGFEGTAVVRGAHKSHESSARPTPAPLATFALLPRTVAEDAPAMEVGAEPPAGPDIVPAPSLPPRRSVADAETPGVSESAIFGKPETLKPEAANPQSSAEPSTPVQPAIPPVEPAIPPVEPAKPQPPAEPAQPTIIRPTDGQPFELRRATIASRVRGFADLTAIEPAELNPGDRIIAYFELSGWPAIVDVDGRLTTEVDYTVQVLDKDGAPIWSDLPQRAKDISRTQRSDLFVTRLVKLPDTIKPGAYALRIVATDPVTQGATNATVPFHVRSEPTK